MVNIALAGGAGNVGQEVRDALVARGKHEILVLSRKDAPTKILSPGVRWIKTSYDDVDQLAEVLKGVHTVLSFVAGPADPTNTEQKNTQKLLIDASIKAGVKRFAPIEVVAAGLLAGILLGISAGNFEISDEWNQIFPDFEFTQPEEFLATAWAAIDAGAKSVHTDY
ncbi:NAD(P)-binding protein [Colletotrichum sublineola]|nr:NAD(P)-binding protein [Colletotrichum sublineola]